MPNYNLKCTECNHKWSGFMTISEKENATCPICNAKAETDFSAKGGSVLIKGNGFYQGSVVR